MNIPTFYIENPAGLKPLLGAGINTIVFKLFDNADGTLSLHAFSCNPNHKGFGKGIKLNTDTTIPSCPIDKPCFIGDLEIGDHGHVKDIEELKNVLKNNVIKKIRMKPTITAFNMPPGYNKSTLTYDFSFLDKDGYPVQTLFAISKPNPCPPYNSY